MDIQSSNPDIIPFLWFSNQAEEAMQHYVSIFPNSRIEEVRRYRTDALTEVVISGSFVLNGHRFMALNGGPHHHFTPAVSFFVTCKNQEEVDYYYNKLLEGGREDNCGWLQDKFGLSWQIIPDQLSQCLGHPDPAKAAKAMEAMLKMKKIIVADLEAAVA